MSQSANENWKDEDGALLRILTENATDYAAFLLAADGSILRWNAAAQRLLGYCENEIVGQSAELFFNSDDRQRHLLAAELMTAAASECSQHSGWYVRCDGSQFWGTQTTTTVRDSAGVLRSYAVLIRDQTKWKQRELEVEEQVRLAAFSRDVGLALVQNSSLADMLHRCAEALVTHLQGAFGRIWTLDAGSDELHLRASAGLYTHLDGPHSRVPVGKFKIGLIAAERSPHLTNAVVGDPRVSEQAWAVREGMVGFAGYPLIVDEQVVGVIAMFARHNLTDATLAAMAAVANGIAVGIQRKQADDALRQQREWLSVTLSSIGDAVIATDTRGRVTFLNGVAEALTGWTQTEAQGLPLETVFNILNEHTRLPVETPVATVLKEGRIVGLGNHTVLVARDGTIRPIDDSAAPIRSEQGELIGVVLVFRDVTEQYRAADDLRRSEARKSAIMQTALDCIISIDHLGNVIEFNPAAETTFGFTREYAIGKELAGLIIPPNYREKHRKGLAHYLATGEGPVLGKRIELSALRSDGSEIPVELSITRIPADGPAVFTAYLRDISERKRIEQHRSVRLAVTNALNAASGVQEGVREVLRGICENLNWDIGVFWLCDKSAEELIFQQCWQRPDTDFAQFNDASEISTFAMGNGLPGRAWASGHPEWISDIVHDPGFRRFIPAARAGLHSAFACPIVAGTTTSGVLEFFTTTFREPDADLLEMMGTVANSVAHFLERKFIEEKVRRSEEELSDFFDNASVGLHWVNETGEILRVNQAELDLLGYRREEFVGRSITEFHVDSHTISEMLMRLHRGEKLSEQSARLRCSDGTIKDVLVDSSALFQNGKFVHSRCFIRDVTDSKRNAADLTKSAERLRLALEAGRMGVWDWNVGTGELNWSDTLEPLHGLPPGTFGGTFEDFQNLIHREDRDTVDAAIRTALANGSGYEVEFRNIRPDGAIHWIVGKGKVFPDGNGRPGRMIGIGMDVTKAKRAEQTARFLADASAALSVLVDFDSTLQKVASLAVPYFADWATVDLLEPSGVIRRVAVAHVDAAKIELGHELHRKYPPDPKAAHGIWSILRSGQSECIPVVSDEVLAQGTDDAKMIEDLRKLGLRSYIGVPLKVRGKPLGVVTFIMAESGHSYDEMDLAVAEDLASRAAIAIENAQLYRELRQADQRKDEFLATLAHELRNPLAPIRNGLQVLRLAGSDAVLAVEARSMMERQLGQMVRLVDDLLDVSRVTRNKLDLRKKRIELSSVVHSAVETSRPLIEQSGHTLHVSLPNSPVYLDADLVRLAQVFLNLLNNSAKYTEPGGQIALVAETVGSEVHVRVRDNGLGIPAEALQRVFEMFSQVDRNLERSQGGLGIGLTLVRRLVEMHGGRVEARSDGPGHGSEFTVCLPVFDQPSQPEDAAMTPQKSATPTAKRRILVVDDNQDSAMSLGMMLKIMGNETHTAHDGLAAIEAAEEFQPNIILLDIGLPKLNGYDACRRIREQPWSSGMMIVALTGWGQDEDRRRSAEAGFDHHMVKPIEIDALEKLLVGTSRS